MPYVIPEKKLAVFFSPKSAGTTIRALLFELENGFPFRPHRVQGVRVDANKLARNRSLNNTRLRPLRDHHRIAVVRDPVRRFLSAYSNRVLHYRELSVEVAGEALEDAGLPPDPDLATFVRNLEGYAEASWSIHRHTLPQQVWLGPEPGYFDAAFRVEALGELPRYLEARYGTPPLGLPRLQTGGPKIRPEDVDPEVLDAIRAHVADDVAYRFFPEYRAEAADAAPARRAASG